MSQKQFTTFQADILSFELREALLGIVKPGRLCGFDTIAADGTPAGNIIFLSLSHSESGIEKQANGASALSAAIGVAISRQGTIIHEDDVAIDIDIPDNNGSIYDKWYLIYMEHDYVEVAGANNATYGFVAGTPNAGIPALTEEYHRIVLGYIHCAGSGTSVSDLTYHAASSIDRLGSSNLGLKLFGSDWLDDDSMGTWTADLGIIGDRDYTGQNHISSTQSITQSLRALDNAIDTLEKMDSVDGTRKLDDWGTADDNTDLDATATEHGLLPKLVGDADYFLDGVGTWTDIHDFIDQWVYEDSPANIFSISDFSGTSGTLDLSALLPVGTKSILLDIYAIYDITVSGSMAFRVWKGGFSAGQGSGVNVGNSSSTEVISQSTQVVVPVSASRTISWSGNITALTVLTLKLQGWMI